MLPLAVPPLPVLPLPPGSRGGMRGGKVSTITFGFFGSLGPVPGRRGGVLFPPPGGNDGGFQVVGGSRPPGGLNDGGVVPPGGLVGGFHVTGGSRGGVFPPGGVVGGGLSARLGGCAVVGVEGGAGGDIAACRWGRAVTTMFTFQTMLQMLITFTMKIGDQTLMLKMSTSTIGSMSQSGNTNTTRPSTTATSRMYWVSRISIGTCATGAMPSSQLLPNFLASMKIHILSELNALTSSVFMSCSGGVGAQPTQSWLAFQITQPGLYSSPGTQTQMPPSWAQRPWWCTIWPHGVLSS